MESFKWIWNIAREYRYRILFGLFLIVLITALNMVNPYVSGQIVDRVIEGNEKELLIKLISIMAITTLVRSLLRYLQQLTFENISQNTVFKLRMIIYSKLQELDFEFLNKNRTGDIMARMTGDLEAVRHFFSFVIYAVFERCIVLIFGLVMLFRTNVPLTLALLTLTPAIGTIAFRLAKEVRPAFFAIREQFARLNSVAQENISGNRVVKAFARESYEIEKFEKENLAFKEKNMQAARIWGKHLPFLEVLAGSLSVINLLIGGIMVIYGRLSLGQLVMFNGYAWVLNDPMRMAGWLINDIQRFAASSVKIISLLKAEPKVKNTLPDPVEEEITGAVEFKNVSFSYGEEKVLEDISFSAKPGQTIAIVGPTGSGKSTLVSLIPRFYDCTEGEVLIDGKNVKEYDLRHLRSGIAVAMQDVFLFSDTIEGNIAYGEPEAPMEKVEWAAGIASASDFITQMPEGYDTIIGERGVGLSGGQKQRMALARAILKDPAILILDDTTSSVDVETEFEIQKMLKSALKNKTTFIIAHRISSVKNADLILVLDKGRIVERGKHDQLLKENGYYRKVYETQVGDFDNSAAKEVV